MDLSLSPRQTARMGWGRTWDRLTGGPRRRQRAMLRRLEELDRLDAAAGGPGRGGLPGVPRFEGPPIGPSGWRSPIQPVPLGSEDQRWRSPRRRRASAGTLVVVLVAVAGTAGLVMLRQSLTSVHDTFTATPITGGARPTGLQAGSLSRLVAAPAAPAGTGGYTFMAENSSGPAAYDPCRPVQFVVNQEVAVPGADRILADALAMTEQASGLRLVLEGPTDELASEGRPAMDLSRYGDRWSPVLVAWTTPERIGRLDGNVAGIGGSQTLSSSGGRLVNVSGIVYLDAPAIAEMVWRPGGHDAAVAIVAHELTHVIGLGHVDSDRELMSAKNSGQTTFGDGDRRGLARLADRPCQLEF